MQITFKQAALDDVTAIAEIINPIVERGGTTAQLTPLTLENIKEKYIDKPSRISCLMAMNGDMALAFQMLYRADDGQLPYIDGCSDWGVIATFARLDHQAKGVGGQMFEHTRALARADGIIGIDATIRADNIPGLKYYTRCGFVDFHRTKDLPLSDGTIVDRIHKIYKL